jgi:septation ring formation regulator EzrA
MGCADGVGTGRFPSSSRLRLDAVTHKLRKSTELPLMKNITLAVNENVLEKVRRYAVSRDTTVNAIVREHLEQIAKNQDRLKQVVAELRKPSENSQAELGPGYKWSREDCYGH